MELDGSARAAGRIDRLTPIVVAVFLTPPSYGAQGGGSMEGAWARVQPIAGCRWGKRASSDGCPYGTLVVDPHEVHKLPVHLCQDALQRSAGDLHHAAERPIELQNQEDCAGHR